MEETLRSLRYLGFKKVLGLYQPLVILDVSFHHLCYPLIKFIQSFKNLIRSQPFITQFDIISPNDLLEYLDITFPSIPEINRYLFENFKDICLLSIIIEKFPDTDIKVILDLFNINKSNVSLRRAIHILYNLLKEKFYTYNIPDVLPLYLANPILEEYIKYKPEAHILLFILENIQHKALIDLLLENKYYIFQLQWALQLYVDNPILNDYIKYKPEPHILLFILENIQHKALINLLLEKGYYTFQLKDILQLYVDNPILEEYIKYIKYNQEPNILLFILENIKHKALIDLLLHNGYYICQLLRVLQLYVDNPILNDYIKYKPEPHILLFILENIQHKALIDLLLENGYYICQLQRRLHNGCYTFELKDILQLYVDNPILYDYIKYKPEQHILLFILENIQHKALIDLLLHNGCYICELKRVLQLCL